MPTTISDVAREAGVSTSTVSKVLNNWTTISPATAARVHSAIKKLDYTPNSRAVSFARQATKNIVFLTSLGKDEAYNNPHMFDIMCGANQKLSEEGFNMTLVNTSKEAYAGETVAKVIAKKEADGMIIHGSAINREIADQIVKEQYPHIMIGHPAFESPLCWVDTNQALAGQTAAEHMLSCGYTDVAFIGGHKTDDISMQRQKGFINSMNWSGHRVVPERVFYTDSSVKDSMKATLELLSSPNRPQAIVCENNQIAVGTMRSIERLKLSVPEDIAFLTFDLYPYSNIITPTPTVVHIDVYDMGYQAGAMMLRKLENPALQIQSYTTLPVIHFGQTTRKDS